MPDNIQAIAKAVLDKVLETIRNDSGSNTSELLNRLDQLAKLSTFPPKYILLIIFLGETSDVLNHAKNAAKQLEYSDIKLERLEQIIKSRIPRLFQFIIDSDLPRGNSPDEGNERFDVEMLERLRGMFEEVMEDLERLYDDVSDQILSCTENQVSARFSQRLSSCIGISGFVAAGMFGIYATKQRVPFSYAVAGLLGGGSIAFMSFCNLKESTNAIKNYQETICQGKSARSLVLNSKIAVGMFITKINTLCITRQMFTDEQTLDILRALEAELRSNLAN